ncbi:ANK [Mytilus edulis]|uniref:ANK n=1 Tax=Mytilus edulis TaxID=6550 RepID=A0A8S3VAW2_MYTED|nr:ANK [Mytilus edulis]
MFERLVQNNSPNVTDYVRRKPIDPFDVLGGSSPLHIACFMGRIDVVRCLLDHNANINITKEDGTTPLFYACEVGHDDLVHLLLDKAADTELCRFDDKSPLNIATENRHDSIVKILTERKRKGDNTTETVDIADISDEVTTIYGGTRSHDASVRIQEEHVASTTTSSNEGRTLINLVSRLSSTVQSLQQNVSSLNGNVNSLLVVQPNTRQEEVAVSTFTSTGSQRGEAINNSGNSHNLDSTYASLNRTTIPAAAAGSENQEARSVRTSRGYSAETLPFVEIVSPQLRKNIISGLDINLASVLIPYYVGSGTSEMFDGDDKNYKTDPRLTRSLSIGEFIQAFSIYKSVMCSAFPHRRSELDSYERDIVDIASRYPGKGFYEYHRRFSLDAAALMRFNNMAVDWFIRNNTIFCNIFANTRPNSCNLCGSTFNTSVFITKTVRIAE